MVNRYELSLSQSQMTMKLLLFTYIVSLYHCQDIYRTLRFPLKNYVRVVLTSRWYLIYVICVYFRIDVFKTYCVVFLFCIVFLLCALCAVFWFVHYWLFLRYSLTFIWLQSQIIGCCTINVNSPTAYTCFIAHILYLSNFIDKTSIIMMWIMLI
jgi:hypothetical protein